MTIEEAIAGPDRVSASQQLIDESEIRSTMIEMARAFKSQDLEKVMSFYAPSADLTIIGSYEVTTRGLNELRQVFEKEFREQEPADITTISNAKVISYGTIAWSNATSTRFVKKDGRTRQQRGRFTTVWEKHGKKWLVIHSHFSVPLAYEETGAKRQTKSAAATESGNPA